MKICDEAMNFLIFFFKKNKIEIGVIRRLIIRFQSFSDDWPTSVQKNLASHISCRIKSKFQIKKSPLFPLYCPKQGWAWQAETPSQVPMDYWGALKGSLVRQ